MMDELPNYREHEHDEGATGTMGATNRAPTMTLEEQVGQLLMAGFWGTTPSQEIIDLIQHHHVGNILLFSRNVRDAQQVLELTQNLQRIAQKAGQHYPLLIAIDQENGIVQRLGEAATLFPGNMALGAAGSEEIANQVALATGHELQALGINMNLAPVVDVNNNPANPVIGVRSFGEDAQQVALLGAAMVKGYHEAGIISCLKHFPGHGDTAVDSHLALPTIPYALERLEALELVPFRSGIEAGAECVMIAHISFPALTQQISDMGGVASESAATTIATLSPAIVQGLLREKLGFNGVVLSDCMEMKAISDTFGTERAAVMALQAGIDLVLVSHNYTRQRGSFEAIRAAVQASELSPQVIQQAAERVVGLKATLGDANVPTTPNPTLSEEDFFDKTAWEGTSSRRGGRGGDVEWGPLRVSWWGPAGRERESKNEGQEGHGGRPQGPPPLPSPPLRDPTPDPTGRIGREAHIELQNRAYELSTTLVRNEDGLLPLHLNSREGIVILSPQRNTMTMVEDRFYSDDALTDIIEHYHPNVRILPVAQDTVENAYGKLLETTSEADIFVVATVNAHLDERQAELVRYLVSSGRRVIGIAVRNPYDLLAFPQLRTYLATYEYTRPALTAAVQVLFGERHARGHLPVSIPGLYPQVPSVSD